MSQKWVYYFGEGSKGDKALLGGKGANLSEMTRLGLPIPTGFTLTTRACMAFQQKKQWPLGMREQTDAAVAKLEKISGKKFGDPSNPLLVSVRSGAAVSMPGMMDTVLNLGLNASIVSGLARLSNNERFAYDSYRRFITMFADVVSGLPRRKFDDLLDAVKEHKGYKQDTELTAGDLRSLCDAFLDLYAKLAGKPLPMDPQTQLTMAIDAVFSSWNNPRAIKYRKINHLPDDMGTAVNVQEMVYGNMGDDCATGVAFTRNPSTGENKRYGEYLCNAQGEDVVAGIRTPLSIYHMKQDFPVAFKQLFKLFETLEHHYKDMQDIEFTVERQKLFILQTRNGKRTAKAAVIMAVDMINEGLVSKRDGLLRVSPTQLETLMHKALDPEARKKVTAVAKGLPASPGAGVGRIVFTADRAVELHEQGQAVVLVRLETSPEDIGGMNVAQGVLTARGGMTSHAAVVARGMNVCCVAGCSEISVNEEAGTMRTADGKVFREGEWLSLDGSTGEVFAGKMPVVNPELGGEFKKILDLADEFSSMEVLANADTPKDALVAREFGAKGIGLVRTEHMFFAPDRIFAVRQMILAEDEAARRRALAKLLPFQKNDFHGILEAMDGLPCVIRLIDPPLHEFLPKEHKDIEELAKSVGRSTRDVEQKAESMAEFNPMLGFRGCRLGVVYPEINEMQVTAIFQAAVELRRQGKNPRPMIEVPLVGNVKEFRPLKQMIQRLAQETGADQAKVHYEIGTMIEVPRAALTADEIAQEVQFMSFGTNDLTQMTCGFSRDDSGTFLKEYVNKGIYKRDPFQSIDQGGVGKLMQLCVSLARATNPSIDVGICGEHAGEPSSVEFCHRTGLNNVSCSPYRVPVARLAAAQAAIKYGIKPKPQAIFSRARL